MQGANDGLTSLAQHDPAPPPPRDVAGQAAIPDLKPHLFYPSVRTADKGSLDIIVIYMFTSNGDDSDISLFTRDTAKRDIDSAPKKSLELQQEGGQPGGASAKIARKPTAEQLQDSAGNTSTSDYLPVFCAFRSCLSIVPHLVEIISSIPIHKSRR